MAPAGEGPCPCGVRALFNPMPWGSSSAALGAPAWEKLVSVPGLAAHLWPRQRSEGASFHFLPSEQRRGAALGTSSSGPGPVATGPGLVPFQGTKGMTRRPQPKVATDKRQRLR